MFLARQFTRHLEDGEELHVVVHRHWLFGVRALTWPVLSLLLCIVFLGAAQHWAIRATFGVLGLMTIEWGIRRFLDFYLDAWLVTNTSVIDIEWKGWFKRNSSRMLYSDIQGVSLEVSGFWPTVLRYGTLSVEKVSTGTSISLPQVPKTKKVESLILKSMETYLHTKNLKNTEHVHDILAAIVSDRAQLNQIRPIPAPELTVETPPSPAPAPTPAPARPAPKPKASFSSTPLRKTRS